MQKIKSDSKAVGQQCRIQRPSSLKVLNTNACAADILDPGQKRVFSKELIKQRLSNLIRKEDQPKITINKSIEKCRSPFSKAKLYTLLQKNSKGWIESMVVKRQKKQTQASIIDAFPNESKLASNSNEQPTIRTKLSFIESNKENQQNPHIKKKSKISDSLTNNHNRKIVKTVAGGKQSPSFIEQQVRSFYRVFHP